MCDSSLSPDIYSLPDILAAIPTTAFSKIVLANFLNHKTSEENSNAGSTFSILEGSVFSAKLSCVHIVQTFGIYVFFLYNKTKEDKLQIEENAATENGKCRRSLENARVCYLLPNGFICLLPTAYNCQFT